MLEARINKESGVIETFIYPFRTLGHHTKDYWESDYHVSLHAIVEPIAWGIPFINICQMLAFYKAIETDHNPDIPGGLNPYISLK